MLPLNYLRPSMAAIEALVRHYDFTAVLCTATQPPLERMECPLALGGKAELTTEQTDNIPTGGVSRGLCKLFFSMAFAQNIIHFPLGTDGA